LARRDPEKRLGSGQYGTQNIKNHPFFAKVNWDKLYKRQIEPPYKPHLVRAPLLPPPLFTERPTPRPQH
jgi:hypothetical protein